MSEKRCRNNRLVVYPGTFDPITNGHLDIIKRAVKLFGSLIVLVVRHSEKSPLFSLEERIEFIRSATVNCKGIEIDSFDGLLMNYAKEKGIRVIIRGLRAVSDFDYEFQMMQLNRRLYSEVETIFIMPREEYFFLSSSTIKEIVSYGGDVSSFVPKLVVEKLRLKFKRSDVIIK
ncbi:MAG: pantetheine-phosphate adenylyltransferase [Candidatus Stahlbacteria bacterium]|nr:pantetheine-phosphate adenylyltransferase [Candidatus Stahlbacteria bacterium]